MNTAERFWAKVDFAPRRTRCWLWTGAVRPRGHGAFQIGTKEKSKVVHAHRFAYELLVGEIPDGLQIHHTCFEPSCVNPEHMELVTHIEHKRRHRHDLCVRGHEIVELPSGIRRCRECHARQERDRKARRFAELGPGWRSL